MIKNIFYDFDGVILDSMPIREYGFKQIFKNFKQNDVEKLLIYHNANGGFSRFVKIRYFFEEILEQSITDDEIQLYADQFSDIMKKELINKKYLIEDTVAFIKANHAKYNFHIVSGSEHVELNYLCKMLELEKYFNDINGSPTPKIDLVKNILDKENYTLSECILIGDSINDYDAAKINNIDFYGFNNEDLRALSKFYLDNMNDAMS